MLYNELKPFQKYLFRNKYFRLKFDRTFGYFDKFWYKHNAYKVLGIKQTASLDEIRTAYYINCKRLHPDTASKSDSDNKDAFHLVSAAYLVLKDANIRRQYDEYLTGAYKVPTPLRIIAPNTMVELLISICYVPKKPEEIDKLFARLSEIYRRRNRRMSYLNDQGPKSSPQKAWKAKDPDATESRYVYIHDLISKYTFVSGLVLISYFIYFVTMNS